MARESIVKNDNYIINMRVADEDRFKEFVKIDHSKFFKAADDKFKINVKIISNEFTHNFFINSLMTI